MEKSEKDIFERLFEILKQRKDASPETSYTAKLMHGGTKKICGKIIEEAAEVCEAALLEDKEHLIYEICDLLFHTFVMASYKDIELADIQIELQRRFGIGGLVEKAARNKNESQ